MYDLSTRHRPCVLVAAVLMVATVVSTGCSAARTGEDAAPGTEVTEPTAAVVAQPSEVLPGEAQGTEAGEIEAEGSPPAEEPSTSEAPAAGGGGRVSVELAGLPVGGGDVLDVDGSWCQVLFWRSVPAGVWLDIESVRVKDEGGTVSGSGCDASPPCVGARISADGPSGCAVLVRPREPDVTFVEVQLNGTLSCPDQAACDELGATDGSWTRISSPVGEEVPTGEPSTNGGDGSGGSGADPDDEPSPDGGDAGDSQASTGTG